tara:strand:+ start:1890 stop:2519 length:630 start_codon:yes stop_codon:yes gene_type:complete
MSLIIYVVGPPASGKTTLVRQFLYMKSNILINSPKITLSAMKQSLIKDDKPTKFPICAAGHYSGNKFDGADTIPISQIHKTIKYMVKNDFWDAEYTFLDGDKLASMKLRHFFSLFETVCIYLDISMETHIERAAKRKSKQNLTWVKGRFTKARRFYETFPENKRLRLNADKMTTEEMFKASEDFLYPHWSKLNSARKKEEAHNGKTVKI